MEFSPQQDNALVAVRDWLNDPGRKQVFRLFGFAGTGKTTLAQYLAQDVDGNVVFAAYTGKAAHVLKQKGCPNARTIHSLAYKPQERGAGKALKIKEELQLAEAALLALGPEPEPTVSAFMGMKVRSRPHEAAEQRVSLLRGQFEDEQRAARRPHFSLNIESELAEASLLVVDECSMVDQAVGADLEWFKKPILVLGDPAQLPPVMGGGYFTDHEPDVLLTEVHRQARESGILRLATTIRSGGSLPSAGSYGPDCRIVQFRQGDPELAHLARRADQIIVGRNATRHAANQRYRQLEGRDAQPTPLPGDKLVCLRNDHEAGLLNGTLWRVHEASHEPPIVRMTVSSEDDGPAGIGVDAHEAHFLGNEKDIPYWERRKAQEFDYGYALTCHKAQGSGFDEVLLYDESFAFRADRARWLYTGITRAAKALTVVRGM